MTIDRAIKMGFKKFPDNIWRKKVTETHILKNGSKTTYKYWHRWHIRKCKECKKDFLSIYPTRELRCSRKCIPNKDGFYKSKKGYIYIRYDGGPWRAEHRLVMEQFIGRPLAKEEYVHHKNHKRDDNRLKNLKIVSLAEHNRIHKPEEVLGWERKKTGQFI